MPRRGISNDRKRASVVRSALRAVSRGERPVCSGRRLEDGTWSISGMPWIMLDATTSADGVAAARSALAAMLEVEPEHLDFEIE